MKKLLFAVLCLALVGCSGSTNQTSDQSSKSKPATGTPEDTSTNHVKISEIGSYYHDGELYKFGGEKAHGFNRGMTAAFLIKVFLKKSLYLGCDIIQS